MPALFARQSWGDNLPGAPAGNGGTIAWSVCLGVSLLIGIPALIIWRRRRKQVAEQMAKTAEGAAAWRAHRANEAREADERRQRRAWRREEYELERIGAQRQRDEETVPGYEEGTAPPEYYAPPATTTAAPAGTEARRDDPETPPEYEASEARPIRDPPPEQPPAVHLRSS
jgi:hypothetical protein